MANDQNNRKLSLAEPVTKLLRKAKPVIPTKVKIVGNLLLAAVAMSAWGASRKTQVKNQRQPTADKKSATQRLERHAAQPQPPSPTPAQQLKQKFAQNQRVIETMKLPNGPLVPFSWKVSNW